jgi:hypothetical protein
MPLAVLPEMTFPAPGSAPPMVLEDELLMKMPVPLPMATLPDLSVPISLPSTVLFDVPAPVISTPAVELPEMTLPAAGVASPPVSGSRPPIVLPEELCSINTPIVFPKGAVPVSFVPMKLPITEFG